jgi:hypothetical protein
VLDHQFSRVDASRAVASNLSDESDDLLSVVAIGVQLYHSDHQYASESPCNIMYTTVGLKMNLIQ